MQSIEFINKTTKNIRKIQTNCNLLHLYINNNDILNKTYQGYVIDRFTNNNINNYSIYIPKLKLISRISLKQIITEYSTFNFKIYIIEDGLTLHKKIRLSIIN